jgi:hypothetical protein
LHKHRFVGRRRGWRSRAKEREREIGEMKKHPESDSESDAVKMFERGWMKGRGLT